VSTPSLPFELYQLALRFEAQQSLSGFSDPYSRLVQHWGVTAVSYDEQDEIAERVGTARITIVSVGSGYSPIELLDEWSQDLVDIGEALFDADGEYVPELQEQTVGALLGDLLILDRAWVHPCFRGHQLGPLIAGLSILFLGRGCALAACTPAPTEGDLDGIARDRAVAALGRTWATIGFESFQKGVWVLDMESQSYDDVAKRLLERIS
jgi:hypothetical protein